MNCVTAWQNCLTTCDESESMKFLEGFCKFTGANVKEIIESEISSLPDSLLGAWPLGVYYVSVEDLKKRYGLDG